MTEYLSSADVVRQTGRAGFLIRDRGLLASAAARPRTSAFGQDAYDSIWLKAAALCQSIDNNQALVDGNKRLSWLTTKVFLALNGSRLSATADEGEAFMLDLVAGHRSVDDIAHWLERHSRAVTAPDLPRAVSEIG